MQHRPQSSQVWRKGVPYAAVEDVRPLWLQQPVNRENPPSGKPLARMHERTWIPGKPGWKNGWICCSLTGELLRRDAHIYRTTIPGYVVPLKHDRDETPGYNWTLLEAPLTLHRSSRVGGTEGVGLAYTAMMAQLLEAALKDDDAAPTDAEAEQAELVAWWESEYAIERVRRGLEASIPSGAAQRILDAVLECHLERADPAVIAARYDETEAWVIGRVAKCLALATRHYVFCTCEKCQEKPGYAARQQKRSVAA